MKILRYLAVAVVIPFALVLVGCAEDAEIVIDSAPLPHDVPQELCKDNWLECLPLRDVRCLKIMTYGTSDRRSEQEEKYQDIPCPESTIAPPGNDQGMTLPNDHDE